MTPDRLSLVLMSLAIHYMSTLYSVVCFLCFFNLVKKIVENYVKGLGKAKCLKKMAQKRVVLSLTILLHR